MKLLRNAILLMAILVSLPAFAAGQGTRADYQRADGVRALSNGKVFKTRLQAHWLEDSTKFWYRNDLKDDGKEFILVDAEQGEKNPAFDHVKLAQALSAAAAEDFTAKELPFDSIEFVDDGGALEFEAAEAKWKCDLETYECTKIGEVEERVGGQRRGEQRGQRRGRGQQRGGRQRGGQRRGGRGATSPDGKWEWEIKDFNLYLKSTEDEREFRLSHDGEEGDYYNSPSWSPDSQVLIAYRMEPGDHKEVYMIESSPEGGGRAQLRTRSYDLPGDKLDTREMSLFFVDSKEQLKVDTDQIDYRGAPRLRWAEDGKTFTYEKTDRGHQRFRLIEVNAETGKTRQIIDEKVDTFINGWGGSKVNYLENTDEIIWSSEKDGWRALYLIDAKTGWEKSRITGDYVVRGIDRIDEEKRQVWFNACGVNDDQDPYLSHYYRINFDGTGLVHLTTGDGNHSISYSPDRKYIVDTYSRVDLSPVHELRRVSDGTLVCELERADVSELLKTGLAEPEVFSAKGRDGQTDIWGIICRPMNLDPSKKYPVIEYIYAGPHGSHVPKTFSAYRSMQGLAELGFIVVQCDGMGTANRSKEFHDVCWQNLKDAGFPDRIAWMKAAAERYPYIDVSRVGIYGTSAGGQNAMGAVLFYPEFYKAASANCGCHDNRMDKASWNEQWMGYPVGEHYAESSNVDNAHLLQGALQLVVGEMDTNVPFESTMRVVDALLKSNKNFELIFVPGGGHGSGGSYAERRKRDFFVKHLMGVEPPDWNEKQPNWNTGQRGRGR